MQLVDGTSSYSIKPPVGSNKFPGSGACVDFKWDYFR